MKYLMMVLAVLSMGLAQPALAQTKTAAKPASSDMEILRQKIKADKKLVVAANMQLNDTEARAFWPVYDAYQKDLVALNERMAKAIVAYADAYNKGPVSDETAKKLIGEAIAIEEAEVKMKRGYLPKVEKAVGGTKAARYYQIESKIRAVVRYELAGQIPLVQ